MLIESQELIEYLESVLNEIDIDFYNEFTADNSIISRKTIYKIIELINKRYNKN
jgi:hypothetical protein